MYVLEVEGTQRNPLTSLGSFDLTAYIDGQYTGRRTLHAPYGTSSTVRFYLPRRPPEPTPRGWSGTTS